MNGGCCGVISRSGSCAHCYPVQRDGGEASPALLEAVKATVMRDDVQVLTDTVEVVSATIIAVDIEATVYLYPHAARVGNAA